MIENRTLAAGEAMLERELPQRLDFVGEFGAEVNSFIPFVYFLHLNGRMEGRVVTTYAGMRVYYYFLDDRQIEFRDETRCYVPPGLRPFWLPNRDDHASVRTPFEVFPDYRAQFRSGMFAADRNLLVVHNKVTPEWGQAPVNMLSLDLLDRIFGVLGPLFRIVYLRPGLRGTPAGYSGDHQPDLAFDDLALLRNHPDVVIFDDLSEAFAPDLSYNEVKLRLYADAHFHITVQGGNAHLLSLFKGGMVAIYHRAGQEIFHSYARGHFSYAASPPPLWLICRDAVELLGSLPLFRVARLAGDEIMLPGDEADVAAALSPDAQLQSRASVPHGVREVA
jgi:hypothetical protein